MRGRVPREREKGAPRVKEEMDNKRQQKGNSPPYLNGRREREATINAPQRLLGHWSRQEREIREWSGLNGGSVPGRRASKFLFSSVRTANDSTGAREICYGAVPGYSTLHRSVI
jgi:hypothetical protein